MVQADHGWWFPEEDGNEPHLFGVVALQHHNLMPVQGYNGSFGFGAPYKCMICQITKGEVGFQCVTVFS